MDRKRHHEHRYRKDPKRRRSFSRDLGVHSRDRYESRGSRDDRGSGYSRDGRGSSYSHEYDSSYSRDESGAGATGKGIVYVTRGCKLPHPSCTPQAPRYLSVGTCKSLLEDLRLGQAYALAERRDLLVWELVKQSDRSSPPLVDGAVHIFVEELQHPNVFNPSPFLLLDDPSSSELPFKGRQEVMVDIAVRVDKYYQSACSQGGITRDGMLFISFEGLSGIGKTRCLREVYSKVAANLSDRSKLKELYGAKAVTSLYISFNCTSVADRASHSLCPFFEKMISDKGAKEAGRNFMQACLLSEGVFGLPFASLSEEQQRWVLYSDEGMGKLADNIRSALRLQHSQRIFVYALLDEAQALVSDLSWTNAELFLKGMRNYIGKFMSSTSGPAPWESFQMVLLPVVAGTLIPEGGKLGLSDWLPMRVKLEYVSEDSAVEIIQGAVRSNRFPQCEQMVRNLIRDTSCLPRYLEYICIAWKGSKEVQGTEKKSWGSADDLPLEDFEKHIRKCLHSQLERSAKKIAGQDDRDGAKRMIRLCVTGDSVPVMGNVEKRQCTMGYVSWKSTRSGFTFHSPVVFLASLAKELQVHTSAIPLHVSPLLKGNDFELPLLDIIHARMLLYAGTIREIAEIFPGAFGSASALGAKMKIGEKIVSGVESAQFYVRNGKKDGFASLVLESGVYFTRPFGRGDCSMVTKTFTNTLAADMRVFASNEDKEIEIWGQAKGKTKPVGPKEAFDYIKACFQECFNCGPGVEKFCVLFSLHGFTFPRDDFLSLFKNEGDSKQYDEMFHHTVLLDRTSLDVIMPGVVQRHYCRS